MSDESAKAAFNSRLESLRGLAALSVLVTHSSAVFVVKGWELSFLDQPAGPKVLSILDALLSAGGAVVFFFVLSGYVLTLSLLRSSERLSSQVGPFLVRRAFRLFPAMWVSVLAIMSVRYYLPQKVPSLFQHGWFSGTFGTPMTGLDIGKNLTLIDFRVNGVTWTMYVEAICSVLLPILVGMTRKGKFVGLVLLCVLITLAFWCSDGDAGRYLFCFQIGVLVACYPSVVQRAQPPVALFIGGIVVLSVMQLLRIELINALIPNAVGGTMMLVAVLTARSASTFQWLDLAPIRFLGRVSYSIYLLQLSAIYIVAQILVDLGALKLGSIFPTLLLIVGAVGLTAPIAWVSYNAIELPMVRCGKTVAVAVAGILVAREGRVLGMTTRTTPPSKKY
jgi:peptidoglycan/LPS O-acetylase OafA/YrhL